MLLDDHLVQESDCKREKKWSFKRDLCGQSTKKGGAT